MDNKSGLSYGAVIVTYNRRQLLVEAVHSLLNQTVKPEKIIVIDNASTDGTKNLFVGDGEFNRSERVDYHRMNQNSGGAGGFAEGVHRAEQYNFDWLSLSDDDAIFDHMYFEKIADQIMQHPDIESYAGKVVLQDGRIQVDQRQTIRNWNRLKTYALKQKDYEDVRTIDVFTFCGAMIKMSLVKQIGIPNKEFFIWGDDIEYSLRVRQNSQILLVPEAVLVHKTNVPSIDFVSQYKPDWREYYGLRNHVATVLDHAHSSVLGHVLLCGWMCAKYVLTFTSRFKGYRKHIRRVYRDAFSDGLKNKLGKNNQYLPQTKS